MTETKKENNILLDEKARADALPEDMQIDTGEDVKEVRTSGWALFDFITHWVINWGLNITNSIITADDQWKYQRNKAIDEGRFQGEKQKLLLGSVSEKFHRFTEKSEVQFRKFWNVVLPGASKPKEEDKLFYAREDAVGITSGVFILSFGGHITTLMAQILETPSIKIPLVKFLDKYVTDPIKKAFGKEVDDKKRKAIYHKLENDLSGKSAIGMWGSRFAGIGMVILSMITLGLVDKTLFPYKEGGNLTKDEHNSRAGFGRIPQAVFWGSEKYQDKTGKKLKWMKEPDPNEFTLNGQSYSQYISRMSSLEITGSTITAVTQYLYLMAQEFFGVGPKTNRSDQEAKKAEKEAKALSKEVQDESISSFKQYGSLLKNEIFGSKKQAQSSAKEERREEVTDRNSSAETRKPKVNIEIEAPIEERSVSRAELEKDYTKVRAKDFESKKTQDGVTYTNTTRKHDRDSLKGRKSDSYEDAVSKGYLSRKESEIEAAVV